MKEAPRAVAHELGSPAPNAGNELLRSLAGEPSRLVHVGRHEVRARIIDILRDANGQVIGSTEHIEEVQYLDVTGDWIR